MFLRPVKAAGGAGVLHEYVRPPRLLGQRLPTDGSADDGMEFAGEMVIKATLLGMRTCEVPTTLRLDGRSRPRHLARGGTGGGTSASCWSTAPDGCSSTQGWRSC